MPTTRGGPKRRQSFTWKYLPAQEKVLIVKESGKLREHAYSLREIGNILRRMDALFGTGFFPLGNNVDKLGDATERQGLGTTILEQRPGDTYHAQGASYLGVVLEECGYFQWNGNHHGIEWRLIENDFSLQRIAERLHAASEQRDSQEHSRPAEDNLALEETWNVTGFDSWSKRHLAEYKTDRLGIHESGRWKQNNAKYPHILPDDLDKLNILETYRKEFWEYRSRHPEIKLHKDFRHLNSSQAMCFNLFFPFIADSDFQRFFLMEVLKSEEKKIVACSFEKIPDSSEGTSFDFFIQFESGTRYFFELKYTEKEFGKAASDKRREDKLLTIYKPRLQGLVNAEALGSATFFQNYQILRNLSYLERAQTDLLFLIFPKANENLREAIPSIMKLLTEKTRQRVKVQFLEDITTAILNQPRLKDPIIAAHYSLFAEKYLSGIDTGIY